MSKDVSNNFKHENITVEAPIPKAITSVKDVTVMATPDRPKVLPNFCTRFSSLPILGSALFQDCIITNMSSIPIINLVMRVTLDFVSLELT
jgi:hypothetical protein